MRKFMKKMLALALAVGLCLTCFQPMTAKADNLPVSKVGGPWTVAEGSKCTEWYSVYQRDWRSA